MQTRLCLGAVWALALPGVLPAVDFNAPRVFGVRAYDVWSVVVADFNGDGNPDVAASGGGVVSILRNAGYNVQGVNAATRPARYGYYPNKRSELWFETRDLARDGHVDLSRLPPNAKKRLKKQAMAVEWSMDGRGCRVVEAKEITKQKCQRSPDSLDAMNLAWYAGVSFEVPIADPGPDHMSLNERVFGKQRSY